MGWHRIAVRMAFGRSGAVPTPARTPCDTETFGVTGYLDGEQRARRIGGRLPFVIVARIGAKPAVPPLLAFPCMQRARPRPRQPRIRTARTSDFAALARARVASWHRAYRGVIPQRELERVTVASSLALFDRTTTRPEQTLLAVEPEPDQDPVGYAIVGPQVDRRLPFLGEIFELYIDPDHHARGYGRTLLSAAIWRLVDAGLNPPIVWVLAANPARHFYEACGGTLVAYDNVRFGSYVGRRWAYGWADALPLPGMSLTGR